MRLRGRGDSGAPGDRVLVELVEFDDDAASEAAAAGGTAAAPGSIDAPGAVPRHRRRPLWWVGAAVLVVLAVVVTVANVSESRRAADRRAALAALPWVLPTMDAPLTEVWRVPGTGVVAVTPDVLVVQKPGDLGAVVGIDSATGEQLWLHETTVNEGCGSMTSTWPYAPAPEVATVPVLLCLQFGEVDADTGASSLLAIRTIDARTGAPLADLSVDGTLITGALADDDLVLVTTRPDDTVVVERTDPRTGERAWRYEGEPGSGDSSFAESSVGIEVTDTAVVLHGTRDLALSADTGEVLRADQVPATDDEPDIRLELADGGAVQWRYDRSGGMNGSGRVLDADGSLRFAFDGDLQQLLAYDGAQTVLVVVRWSADGSTGTLTALDIWTGEEVWSESSGWSGTALLELEGRLLTTSDVARMVEERTGRELWQRPVDSSVTMYAPVTDGDVVVLPVRDHGLDLVAVDLATGDERWRMPAPSALTYLSPSGNGLVLAITANEVIAYRP